MNNLAVALAYQGDVSSAAQTYRSIPREFSSEYPEYVYIATGGLLKFRSGEPEEGRSCYQLAAQRAPLGSRLLVLAHWIKEELEADPALAPAVAEVCEKVKGLAKEPMARRLVDLVSVRAHALLTVGGPEVAPGPLRKYPSEPQTQRIVQMALEAASQDSTPTLPIVPLLK